MDRFTWMSEHYEEKQDELESLFKANTVMPYDFKFKLSCRTPDNEVVSAEVLEVCGCWFTCKHPRTHEEFVSNVVEPYEIERFIEAWLAYKGTPRDTKIDFCLSRLMEHFGFDLEPLKEAILDRENFIMAKTFPEFTLVDKYNISGCKNKQESGTYVLKAVCKDKLICLDKNNEAFIMDSGDRKPFEIMDFIKASNCASKNNADQA